MQKVVLLLIVVLGTVAAWEEQKNNYVPEINDVPATLYHHKDIPEENGIYVLDPDTFDDFLRHHDYSMICFYTPWSGRSTEQLLHLEQAAQVLRTEMPPTPFAKVDVEKYPEFLDRFEIHDVPIVHFYIRHKAINQFMVKPDLQKVLDFVRKHRSPISELVKDESSLELLKAHHRVVVGYFGERDDKYNQYQQATQPFEDILFVHSFDPEFRESIGATIVIFKNYEDEEREDYTGEFRARDIKDFITIHRYPSIQPFTDDEAFNRVFFMKNPAIVLFTDAPVHKFNDFMEVAYEYEGTNLVFSHSTFSSGVGQRLSEYVGVRITDLPCVYAIRPMDDHFHIHKHRMHGNITKDNLHAFIQKFKDGKLERFHKSDYVVNYTDIEDNGPMEEIVAGNFEQKVMSTADHSIVMFYHLWSHDAYKFMAAVTLVKLRMGNNRKLKFFRMDMTHNDHIHVEQFTDPKSYPIIMYYNPMNKETPVQFKGDLEEEPLFSFVRQQLAFDYLPPIEVDRRTRKKIMMEYGAH